MPSSIFSFSLLKLQNKMADKIADKVSIIMIIVNYTSRLGAHRTDKLHFRVQNNIFVLRNFMF